MRIFLTGAMLAFSLAPVWANSTKPSNLLSLYCEARTQDPKVLTSRYQALAAQAQQREALGALLPQVSASGQLNRTRRSGDVPTEYYNNQRYTLSLSQHIYNKSAWENYKKFQHRATEGQLQAEDQQAEAAVELARRYFSTLAAQDELELIQAELRTTQKSLDQAEALLAKQRIPRSEALQLQARVATLKARVIEADNELTVHLESLTELVGRPIYEPLSRIRQDTDIRPPAESMDTWVQRALTYNKALLASDSAVHAAQAAVKEGRGGHYPSVSMNLSSQRSDVGYDNVTAPRTNSLIASVNVNIPIYSGGSTSARTSGLYNELLSTQQRYEALRRELIKNSTSAYLNLQASTNKVDALAQALNAATESRLASEVMFGRSLINAVDMLNTVQQEYSARRDLLQTHYDFVINRLMLSRWAGAFSAQSIYDVNVWLEGAPMQATSEAIYECSPTFMAEKSLK